MDGQATHPDEGLPLDGAAVPIRPRRLATADLQALLEETDAALAECLERLERVSATQAPVDVERVVTGLKDLLRAARVDLTGHYARSA